MGHHNKANLLGQVFGFLKVRTNLGPRKRSDGRGTRIFWECLCICGKLTCVPTENLKTGNTISCGCRQGQRPLQNSPLNRVYGNYRRNAKARGFSFGLTKEQFLHLVTGKCHWCGAEPANVCAMAFDALKYNGVDRVDSTLGYTSKNCVPCCSLCNWMKKDLSKEEFLEHVRRISKHQKRSHG